MIPALLEEHQPLIADTHSGSPSAQDCSFIRCQGPRHWQASRASQSLVSPEEAHTWYFCSSDRGQSSEERAGAAGGNHTQYTRHRRHEEELGSRFNPPPAHKHRVNRVKSAPMTYPSMPCTLPPTPAQHNHHEITHS
ncbi:uncharacterized [Tachysurus ichikawai]